MSTIHIQSGKNNLETNKISNIQSVPFKIHADIDAEVTKVFKPYVHERDDCLLGSFRGYPLTGKQVELPDGYRGVVLHETIRPHTEKEERKVYVVSTFKEITYWNWDKVPSKNDVFIKMMDWVEIAEVLHSPIIEE